MNDVFTNEFEKFHCSRAYMDLQTEDRNMCNNIKNLVAENLKLANQQIKINKLTIT